MKDGLEAFTDTYLTVIGLMIFFLFFVGVITWVSRKSGKHLYEKMEHLPLMEGEFLDERV
jgi:cbb3-type cytochrome oxidase subunit 3